MGFSEHDINRNANMLRGRFKENGYDWWWHSFTARDSETGEEKPFFVEFFVCNPAEAEEEPVLGQAKENIENGKKPSYLMVKAGCWGEKPVQLHRFFAWKDVTINKDAPYRVEAADCLATEDRLTGSVCVTREDLENHPEYMCDAGSMRFDLVVNKQIPFNVGYGAGKLLRDIHAFEMYWHAEGMKTTYQGKIWYNDREYTVEEETSYGYADKNWGSDFTTPWVWLSSNALFSVKSNRRLENSVFDIGGGRPRVFGISLDRILLGAFYYEGEEIEFNFSKFWTHPGTKFDCKETEEEIIWHVAQENRDYLMVTNIHCKKKHMLLVNYEAPNGKKEHNRLWNGGDGYGKLFLYKKTKGEPELVDEIIVTHTGCEYGEFCEAEMDHGVVN